MAGGAPATRTSGRGRCLFACLAAALMLAPRAWSVLFLATDDPSHNTTEPSGDLSGSGWQYQGRWGSYVGTAIAPSFFITARHIGGTVGASFVYRGKAYPTTAVITSPTSDLAIWRVCGAFPAYADLYPGADEVGRPLVVFGRGTQRGAGVLFDEADPTSLRGWRPGTSDGVLRWGRNVVTAVVDGGLEYGQLLAAAFDAPGVEDECSLSVGDSGGAVFLEDGGTWKLAGINQSADGLYSRVDTGPGFLAALFDQRGFYAGGPKKWELIPPAGPPEPGAFFATRISSNRSWIDSVLAPGAPADALLVVESSERVDAGYAPETGAVVDPATRTARVPYQQGSVRYYRLRACGEVRILSAKPEPGWFVLEYE